MIWTIRVRRPLLVLLVLFLLVLCGNIISRARAAGDWGVVVFCVLLAAAVSVAATPLVDVSKEKAC